MEETQEITDRDREPWALDPGGLEGLGNGKRDRKSELMEVQQWQGWQSQKPNVGGRQPPGGVAIRNATRGTHSSHWSLKGSTQYPQR